MTLNFWKVCPVFKLLGIKFKRYVWKLNTKPFRMGLYKKF